MARMSIAPLTQWITEAAARGGAAADLPGMLMHHLQISRRSALARLRALVSAQWLVATGTARRRRWQPGPMRQVVRSYALSGLQEDAPWRTDFAPYFELPTEVARMARHAFTELLNNAVDHSGGTNVTVSMRQTPLQVQLLISDDGCGVFERVAERTGIGEPALAMFELSKGRLTSAPERHSGQGLYFCSRLADVFDLHANGAAFQCRQWEPQRWRPGRGLDRPGSSIYLALALDTQRSLDEVLRSHSLQAGNCAFDRTEVPLHLLATHGTLGSRGPLDLVSRAEARRVVSGLAGFAQADLDFTGIDDVGPGFVDELLRVCAGPLGALGPLKLQPVGANDRVRERLGCAAATV